MNQEKTSKLGLSGLTLFSVCAVLVIDTLTASASLGPSSITWWLITLVLFVIPYALIASELGATYPGEGGIYDWVKRAFGYQWAVRTTWFYWVNIALWMPAVYILFAGMFAELFVPDLALWWQIAICIALTWLTVWFCNVSVNVGVWIVKLGAALKIIVIGVLGGGGFIYAMNHGVANEFSMVSMAPNLDSALGFLPVIVFNLLGFELVATMSKEIKNTKDIPKAMFLAAAIVTGLYIFATLGILMALPVEDIGLVSGIVDTLKVLFGDSATGTFMVYTVGIMVLMTFIANMVTWTMGTCRAAMEAAQNGELPQAMAKEDPVRRTPIGANFITGVISSAVILIYGFVLTLVGSTSGDELFWTIFAFSSVVFLLPYLFLFPAHVKLRMSDSLTPRPFKVPGGIGVQIALSLVAFLFIVQAVVLFVLPEVLGGVIDWAYTLPVGLGILITILIGEVMLIGAKKRQVALPKE